AAIRGPLTDTLSGSLTARYYERGGPFTNIYDNTDVGQQESKSISGVLYFQPNDKLDIRARLRYSKLHDDQLRLFGTTPEDNNCIGPDNGGTYLGNFRYLCGELVEQPINIDDVRLLDEKGFDDTETWETSFTVNYELTEELTLTWINGYSKSDTRSKFDFASNPGSLNPFSVYIGPFQNIGPIYPGSGDFYGHAYVTSGPVVDFASVGLSEGWDYSSEIRLAYEGEGWSALLGGYYYDSRSEGVGTRTAPMGFASIVEEAYDQHVERMEAQCDFSDPGAPCLFIVNFGDSLEELTMSADRSRRIGERDNIAAFGMLEYEVTDKLTISGEIRFARERVTSTTFVEEAIYDYMGTLVGLDHDRDGVPDADVNSSVRKSTFNSTNPRFAVRYEATEDINLYAVAARGTKPGGFNNIELAVLGLDTFDEESVWSFEAGAKALFMDGRLRLNVALFHNTINGYQLTQSILIPSLNETTTAIDNAGKVRIKGIELDASFAPEAVPGLILTANYALADSNFLEGDDINEGRHLDLADDGSINCSLGTVGDQACNTTDYNGTPGSIVDRSLPNAPKHMFNLGANYTTSITEEWNLVLNANVSYESKKYIQVHNLAWTGSATLVSASIAFETEKLRLVFWGKNLTDEDSVVSAIRFADPTKSFQRNFLGTPRVGRQFGFTGTFKF
ncbi:MAG: TonB-dependent receptor, partial [Emcibacter sp.]|nr:TonB-dependent receptor [Emcibacter sp.]